MTHESFQRSRVLELLRLHGFNTTSFQTIATGLEYWWDGEDACVAFADTGGAWVAAGAPLADAEALEAVAWRFARAARKAGRRAVFVASQERLASLPRFVSVRVGLQPTWDPRAWAQTIQASRSLRYQLRRAQAKGVLVRRLDPIELGALESPARFAIESLIARWLQSRPMARMAFLVDVQPFSFAEERRTYAAEVDGVVVGFLSAVPVYTRKGWFFEDVIRDPRAPNGTVELLIDAAMRQAASEGSPWVTLGLAPLAGPVPGWMRRLGRLAQPAYDFDGLHAFKSKLCPTDWEQVFVTHPPEVNTHVAMLDVLRAFAGGRLSGFLLRTLLQRSVLAWRPLSARQVS